MKILLHSSKTMKPVESDLHALTKPQFLDEAIRLNKLLQQMDSTHLANLMQISEPMANKAKQQIDIWPTQATTSAAALTFRGDIYSGLNANSWSVQDAQFAQEHLFIMSGLYGLLRPFDGIRPYRLEMGYKLLPNPGVDLTKFWETTLADKLETSDTYVNLTALEYFKVIQKQLADTTVISPKFMTISEKTKVPVFVTVHAKIARGSYANWMIRNQIDTSEKLRNYTQLNYTYDKSLSTQTQPVFMCRQFGGLGLSVRLT